MSAPSVEAEDTLEQVWGRPRSLWSSMASTDHKDVGKRYLVTAGIFFALAGVQSLLIRTQLAVPEFELMNADLYNQMFTLHGVTMIFLFSTPMLAGFGNYFLPLMVGTRDMAFPRLNALSYWIYLASGIFLYSSLFGLAAPFNGWFNYPPLANQEFAPGLGIDFFALTIIFLGISTTVGSINFIVTILKMRTPGMSISRMPLFAWAILTQAFMLVFALPPLTLASIMLYLDRAFDFQFFDVTLGGEPLLWQHLFWIFGHPDVYIILLPALGIVSTIVPVFSRRPIVGYIWVALAMVSLGVVSFGVWVHHMFVVGLPTISVAFFAAASLLVTLPSGIQVFAWLTTMATGSLKLRPPMLHVLGFLITFVLGGFTGVMFAAAPFDQTITDTYFVVAHFHYVLFGGAVFPILGGVLYWLPKLTGRMARSDTLGIWSFWLIFGGFNLTFFPLHITGLIGMPRRIYTYPDGLGWAPTNLLASIGAAVLAIGLVLFIVDVYRIMRHGAPAGPNPWEADSLEWSTSSPPPPYNHIAFARVTSRHPLWDPEDRRRLLEREGPALAAEHHEVLGTTAVEAEPEQVVVMPGASYWPVILAGSLLVLFYGGLARFLPLAAAGGVSTVVSLLGWWLESGPRVAEVGSGKDSAVADLPVNLEEGQGPFSFWGTWLFIATEAMLFASLISSYFYVRFQFTEWPIGGIEDPELLLPSIGTVLLLSSSGVVHWGELGARRGDMRRLWLGIWGTILLGTAFLGIQVYEYVATPFAPQTNVYGSLFYGITGFHGLHVLVGLLMLGLVATVGRRRDEYDSDHHLPVRLSVLYWHFVDVVWIFVFGSLYVVEAVT